MRFCWDNNNLASFTLLCGQKQPCILCAFGKQLQNIRITLLVFLFLFFLLLLPPFFHLLVLLLLCTSNLHAQIIMTIMKGTSVAPMYHTMLDGRRRCTITLATQDNATADGVFRVMDPNLCWFVHAAEPRHQALWTALGFPCLARQWNRKSLR